MVCVSVYGEPVGTLWSQALAVRVQNTVQALTTTCDAEVIANGRFDGQFIMLITLS